MSNNIINLAELEKELIQKLQAVRILQGKGVDSSLSSNNASYTSNISKPTESFEPATTLEERNTIINAIVSHLKATNNHPLKASELYQILISQNINIPSSKPIVTLAAIMKGRKELLKKDDIKQWSLVNF